MKPIRFKRKWYGRGRYPATRQGWAIMLIYLGFVIWRGNKFQQIDATQHSGSDALINFSPPILLATVALIVICYLTGESPKRQRGRPKKK